MKSYGEFLAEGGNTVSAIRFRGKVYHSVLLKSHGVYGEHNDVLQHIKRKHRLSNKAIEGYLERGEMVFGTHDLDTDKFGGMDR